MVQWLSTHNLEGAGSNPGIVYWMIASKARYSIEQIEVTEMEQRKK